jgi:hypothetical protein
MRGFVLFALCMIACTAAFARDLVVGDVLGLQSYGQTVLVAKQRLLLIERRRPYDQAPDFGYDTYFNGRVLTRILSVPLDRPDAPKPLFPQSDHAGYWIGSLSPSETRLTVFRLENRHLSLGVVDLSTRRVRWLVAAPDLPIAAPAPVWTGETHFAFVAMSRPRLPASLLAGTAGTQDLQDLWTRQASGGVTRTLLTTDGGAAPDDGARTLILADASNGGEHVLATGNIIDISLAPSRRRVAITLAGAPVPPPASAITVGFDSRRHHMTIIDLADGHISAPAVEVLRGVSSWSHTDHLLIVTRTGGDTWQRARWTDVDPQGRVRLLGDPDTFAAVEESGAGRLAYGGWAGTSAIAQIRRRGDTPSWARLQDGSAKPLRLTINARPVGSTAKVKWMLDGGTLYAVDPHRLTAKATDVEQAGPTLLDPYAQGYRLARDPDALLLVVTTRGGNRQVRMINGANVSHTTTAVPEGAQILAATTGKVIAMDSDRHAVMTMSIIGPEHRRQVVDCINARLADVDLPQAIDLKTQGRHGEILHDWLLLPAGHRPPPPLIVNPYPGLAFGAEPPRETGISRFAISDNALLLVSAGYAVLLPSMPLSSSNTVADALLPRIDEATDAAVATGRVDRIRIGLIGHSFGGYTVLTLATRSARYKAIVAANGPADLFAMHSTMSVTDKLRLDNGIPAAASIGWTEGGQGGTGGTPASAATTYLAASPMFHLQQVQNPILLITGDLDPVAIEQSERAFMELYRYGKNAQLARYWGEGHTNASAGNIADYWRLITLFFDQHVKTAVASAHAEQTQGR